jgi:flagellar hook-associated protein 3 FlgL
MRVTTYQNRQHHIAELLRSQEHLAETRDRVSSGRRIQDPSDAPNDIAELLRTQSHAAELTQRRDATDASLVSMKASESTLGDITSALRQAHTLALQARSASTSADQRQLLADQIDQIAGHVRDLANTQVNGSYLFAGTATDTVPFTNGPPVTYTGNDRPILLSLNEATTLPTNVTGTELQDARGGTDLFQNLSTLATAIRSGDDNGMASGMGRLDADVDNSIRLRGDIGARIQYVDMVQERTKNDLLTVQERQSQLQDADVASAIVEYQGAQNAQQATLATVSRLDQPSLLDYLR